jgi:hypothetical protein
MAETNLGHRPSAMDMTRHGFAPPARDFGLMASQTIFPIGKRALASVIPTEDPEKYDVMSISDTHESVVNLSNNSIVGVVSKKYKPLENMSFFATVEEDLRRAIPEQMQQGVLVRDRMSGGGAWCQREYVFPAYAEELSNSVYSTQVGLRIVAWNSYDGSASAGLMTGLIDFICTNGIIVGRDVAKEMRRHSTRLEPGMFLPRLRENLGKISGNIDEVRRMANKPLIMEDALHFLEKHMSGARAAQVLERTKIESEMRGETVQALHAALTNYASHVTDAFATRNEDPAREARILRGREDEVYRLMDTQEWGKLAA